MTQLLNSAPPAERKVLINQNKTGRPQQQPLQSPRAKPQDMAMLTGQAHRFMPTFHGAKAYQLFWALGVLLGSKTIPGTPGHTSLTARAGPAAPGESKGRSASQGGGFSAGQQRTLASAGGLTSRREGQGEWPPPPPLPRRGAVGKGWVLQA